MPNWISKAKIKRLWFGSTPTEVTATAAELNIMDGITATTAELNTVADLSARVVAQAAGNFTFTVATHEGKLTVVNDADVVITLPAATGSGAVYHFVVGATAMTAGLVSVTGNDTFMGRAWGLDTDAEATYEWHPIAADNEINMNGTSLGGKTGDSYKFTDILADKWLVEAFIQQSGGAEATPFDTAA